jgi:spermidine synthase
VRWRQLGSLPYSSPTMRADRAGLPGYRAVARAMTADCPVTLHQHESDYVITSCGQVLMATDETGSERALGHLAARLLRGVRRPRILVGGLGIGFTLRALLDGLPESAQVVVAELLGPVVRWNRERFGHLAGHPLDDPRVRLHVGDVADLLHRRASWDAILLDVDNGPDWMVQRRNQALYGRRGIARLLASLRPGGFLALWSVGRHLPFERRLASMGLLTRRFRTVTRDGGAYDPLIYVVGG